MSEIKWTPNFFKELILEDYFLPFPKIYEFWTCSGWHQQFMSSSPGVSSLANYCDPALYEGPEPICLMGEVFSP